MKIPGQIEVVSHGVLEKDMFNLKCCFALWALRPKDPWAMDLCTHSIVSSRKLDAELTSMEHRSEVKPNP